MRVKTGITRRRNHKKIHQGTKGYRMSKHKLVKVSKEAMLHAGAYAFNGRRKKKGDFRSMWIQRIQAGLSTGDLSYSRFINLLAKSKIGVNRKMLSELAISEPTSFSAILEEIQKEA